MSVEADILVEDFLQFLGRNNISATSRLHRLYVQRLKGNPEWEQRRHDRNLFMARLIRLKVLKFTSDIGQRLT
jgi:hypothetical protein